MRPICRDFISLLKGKVTKSGYGKPSDREGLDERRIRTKRKGKLRLKLFLRFFFFSRGHYIKLLHHPNRRTLAHYDGELAEATTAKARALS
jgi:hypothetical protein